MITAEEQALLAPAVEMAKGNDTKGHLARNLIWAWLALNHGLVELALSALGTASYHQTRLHYIPSALLPLMGEMKKRAETLPTQTARTLANVALGGTS
jgi:hypothetical protein